MARRVSCRSEASAERQLAFRLEWAPCCRRLSSAPGRTVHSPESQGKGPERQSWVSSCLTLLHPSVDRDAHAGLGLRGPGGQRIDQSPPILAYLALGLAGWGRECTSSPSRGGHVSAHDMVPLGLSAN